MAWNTLAVPEYYRTYIDIIKLHGDSLKYLHGSNWPQIISIELRKLHFKYRVQFHRGNPYCNNGGN